MCYRSIFPLPSLASSLGLSSPSINDNCLFNVFDILAPFIVSLRDN
jgi:hypothetical protein